MLDQATHLRNLLHRTRAEFRRKYCLHPNAPGDCSKRIISAHTVQRAILKKYIAIENHVMRYEVEPFATPVNGMLVFPKRRGINHATTFFGFCDKHDCELFRPLEATEFSFQPEQIALLGYRAICRDAYGKEAAIAANDTARFYVMMHPDIPAFAAKDHVYQIKRLAMLNARKNFIRAKEVFANMITKRQFTDLRFFAVQFADAPMYVASAMLLPEWDFNGQRLQNLERLDDFFPICFSAWVADGGAAAIFCWHVSADHICQPFIDSLSKTKSHRLSDRILTMAFEYSENIVFRSDWWDAMPERYRRMLANRVMSGVDDESRTARSLLDDGLRALRSKVISKHIGY